MSVWIVIIGEGSFAACYGLFATYDAAVEWVRTNGWHPSECGIYPVRDTAA